MGSEVTSRPPAIRHSLPQKKRGAVQGKHKTGTSAEVNTRDAWACLMVNEGHLSLRWHLAEYSKCECASQPVVNIDNRCQSRHILCSNLHRHMEYRSVCPNLWRAWIPLKSRRASLPRSWFLSRRNACICVYIRDQCPRMRSNRMGWAYVLSQRIPALQASYSAAHRFKLPNSGQSSKYKRS